MDKAYRVTYMAEGRVITEEGLTEACVGGLFRADGVLVITVTLMF